MRIRLASLLVALTLTTAACGGEAPSSDDAAASEPAASPSPAVTPDARYGSVEELKDAAIEAGYVCKRWKQSNIVTLAASSGSCSGADVFSIYATDDALNEQVATQKAFAEGFEDITDPLLVGPNWIINGPKSPELREALGGTLVEY